jgi:hypothetical protein
MRTESKRRRALRARVLAACLTAGLALPAGASAMLPRPDGPPVAPHANAPAVVVHAPAIRHENGPASAVRPTSTAAPSVVREIRTVTDGTDQTLPIALGAFALAIALSGTGYIALRVRPMVLRRSS